MMNYKQMEERVNNMSRQEKDKLMKLLIPSSTTKEALSTIREDLDHDKVDATERSRFVFNFNKENPTIGLPVLQHALGVGQSAYYRAKKIYESEWEEQYYHGFVVDSLADAYFTASDKRKFEKEYPGVQITPFLF